MFANTRLVVSVVVLVIVVSLAASALTGKWHWFGRSGAWAALAGVLLSVRPLVRLGVAGWVKHLSTCDAGHVVPTNAELESERQAGLDAYAAKIGVFMAFAGTLVWAYGDLIGGLP
jgi:hypothetical protein